jgi:D-alanyl-D-alanine carboxypeptidase/D-alanyl-D-alanine-endopeptidase (penicillin-binding protein 4)
VRRWLLPALLGLLAVGLATLALRPPSVPPLPPDDVAGRPAAAVLSARRTPALLSRFVADTRLTGRVDAVLADARLGEGRSRHCLIVRHDGRTLIERQPDAVLVPASNLKLATALAALQKLGPDARFETVVHAAARPRNGVVEGDLWMIGAGDPLLGTKDYADSFVNQPQLRTPVEDLAAAVVAAGVKEVRGSVKGDESRYDTQRYLPSWRPGYMSEGHVGPESALAVNDGFVAYRPRKVAAPDPATHAASVLTDLLRGAGVIVTGPPGQGRAPSGQVKIAGVRSHPVKDLVAEMLTESDNNTAELLTKELGRRFARQGTTAAGLGVVRDTLAAADLPVDHLTAVDGSGLDRGDRASCRLFADILAIDGDDGPIGTGLSVANQSGTLRKRFVGNPAAGRLRAKTGFLDGVVGLSGWVDALRGDDLLFSFVANGLPVPTEGPAQHVQERLGAALATYPEAPPPEELGPRR